MDTQHNDLIKPLKQTRFCDDRDGKFKPHTDVMQTWIDHGFIPPTWKNKQEPHQHNNRMQP